MKKLIIIILGVTLLAGVGFFVSVTGILSHSLFAVGRQVCEFRDGYAPQYIPSGDESGVYKYTPWKGRPPFDIGAAFKCKIVSMEELDCKGVDECKTACQEAEGLWDEGDPSIPSPLDYPLCNLPTDDAGNACDDNSQCQSNYCVPNKDVSYHEPVTGNCYEYLYRPRPNCTAGIKDGLATGTMCAVY